MNELKRTTSIVDQSNAISFSHFFSRTKSFDDLSSIRSERALKVANHCWTSNLPYYYSHIDRERSEEILQSINRRGCFLIRRHQSDSNTPIASPYVLSLIDLSLKIKHFLLYRINGQFFIKPSSNEFYSSIEHLVREHQFNQGVLPCPLTEYPLQISSNNEQSLFIPSEQLQREEIIGRGHFGIVYKGLYHGKIRVAIKTFSLSCLLSVEECEMNMFKEGRMMMCLHHPYLVHLYGMTHYENQVCLVIELICNGSLLSWLQQQQQQQLDNEQSFSQRLELFSYQICQAMTYLESQAIIHRDLAARNCFIDEKANVVKVGDFGMARMIRSSKIYTGRCDTPFPLRWSAPEVLLYREYSSKSDVWSYGILLCEMFSYGQMPFGSSISNELVAQLIQTGQMLSKPSLANQFFYRHVIVPCWTSKVNERPSFFFLKEIFDKILLQSSTMH